MTLISKVQNHLLSLLATPHPTLIIGLSGGPDSVFLFHALLPLHTAQKIRLHAAHINHGWRESATHDEQFCRTLCAAHNIPLTVSSAAEWHDAVADHKKKNASPESLAREIRRAVFAHMRTAQNAEAIVLAHHADDQRETFLLRLIRGSSLTGLCSMHARNGHYLRPLLSFDKATIMAWLTAEKISFCDDETNRSAAHLRNRIRATALPALTACDQRAWHNMDRTITRLQEEDDLLTQITRNLYASLMNEHGHLPRATFCQLHSALQKRLLLMLLIEHGVLFTPSTGFFDEVIRFLSSPAGGTHQMSPQHSLIKKKGWFGITAATSSK